ncbi:unnamed protein product [Rhodiola kirilowii]
MEAIRKQAAKLREQVARQQQAIMRQLGSFGSEGSGAVVDEEEQQCRQRLKNLYTSTRAAKHFQKSIVRGVESFVSICSKEMEIVRKLADDCCRYGNENNSTEYPLARAALSFGTMHSSAEQEKEVLLDILIEEVSDPLRVFITGAPLEDARLLVRHYDKLRQDVEAQAADVLRRQSKAKDPNASIDSSLKVQNAEDKLSDLRSTLSVLGREATDAMLSVEAQQQRTTLHKLQRMVDAEKLYHRSVLDILDNLYAEMIVEEKRDEPAHRSETTQRDTTVSVPCETSDMKEHDSQGCEDPTNSYFTCRVIHPFEAQADGELNLTNDDLVTVRQVNTSGWSEGECNGKVGWFPSAYVEKEDKGIIKPIRDRT